MVPKLSGEWQECQEEESKWISGTFLWQTWEIVSVSANTCWHNLKLSYSTRDVKHRMVWNSWCCCQSQSCRRAKPSHLWGFTKSSSFSLFILHFLFQLPFVLRRPLTSTVGNVFTKAMVQSPKILHHTNLAALINWLNLKHSRVVAV